MKNNSFTVRNSFTVKNTIALVVSICIFVGAVFAPATVETGCTKAQEQSVVASLPPLGACIIEAAGGDFVEAIDDPLSLVTAIATSCVAYGEATAAIIAQVIESWFAATPLALDAGVDSATDAAASASDAAVSSKIQAVSTQASRLLKVHAAALSILAASR